MDKLRIAHFVSTFEFGGIQTVVETLAAAQAREGSEVHLCALGNTQNSYKFPKNYQPYQAQFNLRGWRYLTGILEIIQFLRKNKIHVFHAHPGTISRIAAILSGVPIIISTYHGSWPDSNTFTRNLHKLLASHTTIMVANSNYIRGYFTALFGFSEDRCTTIYNGVNLDNFCHQSKQLRAETRKSFGLPEEAKVVTWTGRLHPDKGIDVLILAAEKTIESVPNTHFLIIGDGMSRQHLEQLTQSRKIGSHVHFIGAKSDVRPGLEAADIFVLPSRREGFGVSLIEAMAMGLPVIGTNLGGIPEIVFDRVNGLLVRPNDVASLADAICELLLNPELSKRLAQNGQASVRDRFSLEKMVSEYHNLYKSLRSRL
jgi:glycosyltransferase involved in cell wall biosynthesis